MTPAGIEPATFRFVGQHLNHCVTVVPLEKTNDELNSVRKHNYNSTLNDGIY